jgi:diaminopimelate decarboxylase
MSAIAYKNNRLFVEEVDVAELAQTHGTPFYCYSASAMQKAYCDLEKAISHARVSIHYAVKANSNLAVIKVLAQCGAKMDIVSGGELKRCLAAGVKGEDIMFSGVGKTEEEMAFALRSGVGQFNVESLPEIDVLAKVAAGMNMQAPVALRVNPDIDAKTVSAKIATGKKENKFGIDWDCIPQAFTYCKNLPSLAVEGVSFHIGSQITTLEPFRDAFARAEEIVSQLRAAGHAVNRVSLGGGLGIVYRGNEQIDLSGFGKLVRECAGRLNCDVELEPGRSLVGEAGILVTKILYVKKTAVKNFYIVDAGMNDLIRPTLYEAYHPIEPVVRPNKVNLDSYDVVGPVCESSDYFAHNRQLPALEPNDFIAILCAGAYSASMSSTYNSRALCEEIMVYGQKSAVIRPRLTIEQQLAWENVPAWF